MPLLWDLFALDQEPSSGVKWVKLRYSHWEVTCWILLSVQIRAVAAAPGPCHRPSWLSPHSLRSPLPSLSSWGAVLSHCELLWHCPRVLYQCPPLLCLDHTPNVPVSLLSEYLPMSHARLWCGVSRAGVFSTSQSELLLGGSPQCRALSTLNVMKIACSHASELV